MALTEFVEEEIEQDKHGAHEDDEHENEHRRNPERNFFWRMAGIFGFTNPLFIILAGVSDSTAGFGFDSLKLSVATLREN